MSSLVWMAKMTDINIPDKIKDLNLDDRVKIDLSEIAETNNNFTKEMVNHINSAADMCKFSNMFNQVEDGIREAAEEISDKIGAVLEDLAVRGKALLDSITDYLNSLKDSDLVKYAEKIAIMVALAKIAQENPELILAELLKSELQIIDQMKANLRDIATAVNNNSCVVLGRRAASNVRRFEEIKNSATEGSLSKELKNGLVSGKSAIDTLRDGMKDADSIKAIRDFNSEIDSVVSRISLPSFNEIRTQAGLPEVRSITLADSLGIAPIESVIPANIARIGATLSAAIALTGTIENEIYGGPESGVIEGTNKNDLIRGGNGYNIIYGRDGNDVIDGGSQGSTIYGGKGRDTISGKNVTVSEVAEEDKKRAGVDTVIFDRGDGIFRIELDRSGQVNLVIRGYGGTEMAIKSMGNSTTISKGTDSINLVGFSEMKRYGGILRVKFDNDNRILTEEDLTNIDEKGS